MLPQVSASWLARVQNLSRWHALTKREMMSSVPLPKVLLSLAQAMGKPRAGLQKKPPPSYNVNERINLLLKLPKCSHVSRQPARKTSPDIRLGGGAYGGSVRIVLVCCRVALRLRGRCVLRSCWGCLSSPALSLGRDMMWQLCILPFSAGAFSSWGPARFSFCFCRRQHHLLSGLFCRPPLHSKHFLMLLDTGSALLT